MLDTIILTIPHGQYKIIDHNRFHPSTENLLKPGFYFTKFVNNPTTADKLKENYLPRLTVEKRPTKNGIIIPLKIEFSAPKLIFGNNLEELEDKNFEDVINALSKKLTLMGVLIPPSTLTNGSVSGFHPSKNIILTKGYTATGLIKELAKVNLTKKLDLTKTTFRNDGHSLQLYSASHSVVAYDKVSDLTKSESRAIDKDQTANQLSLFNWIQEQKRSTEILRLEIRLSKKVKLNSVLVNLGHSKNPTFQQIFNQKLCQKILKSYWKEYFEPNQFIFDMVSNPLSILKSITKNPKIKAKEAIYLTGLKLLAKDEGIRPIRQVIERRNGIRAWQRVSEGLNKLNQIKQPLTGSHIKDIVDSLEKFETYRF